jgi:PPIC-type PPIASE domain
MIRNGLVCLLLAVLAWGQVAKSPQDAPTQTAPSANPAPQTKPAEAEKVAPDAAVITINGLCDPPTDKTAASGCKVVFTRAQFETFADLVQPNLSLVQRRQLAANYADTLILAEQAQEMGLDKGPRFEQLLMLQRLSLLRQLLIEALQQKAAEISDKDIADYYQQHISTYEEAQLQPLYVPLSQQLDPPKGKLTASELQRRLQDSQTAMKNEADELHGRAVAGEDFAKLQEEAYKVALIKTAFPPSKVQTYRRRDLSPAQVSVMNLKSGEISPVISDANGYFIYKVGEKDTVPLEKARDQIISTLRLERLQQFMKAAQQSATTVLNEEYFTGTPGAGAQGMSVPHRVTPKGGESPAAE